MNRKLQKIILFFCLYFISALYANAQAPLGDMRSVQVENNYDTLIINRTYSDWWFGISGGSSLIKYFGDLNLPRNNEIGNPFNSGIVTYPAGEGKGLFLGVVAEWLPVNKKWGAILNVRFIDTRDGSGTTDAANDSVQTQFANETFLKYLSISPSARYNFPLKGLHAFAGFDIEVNLDQEIKYRRNMVHSGLIADWRRISINDLKTRLGVHFGVGIDLFSADVNNFIRVKISPFASIHAGTKILGDNGSNWNSFMLKAGVSVKMEFDKRKIDTLKFNPNYIEPPRAIASVKSDRGINFTGFRYESDLEPITLAVVDVPEIMEEIREEPKIDIAEVRAERPVNETPVEKKIPVDIDKTVTFEFSSQTSSNIDDKMKAYFNSVAGFMKANPKTIARIVGHSDDRGTLKQNTDRSNKRAESVTLYLISRGIPRSRIFGRGVGSIYPLGDNNTAAGRRKNRRVEIQIVQQ